MSNADRVTGILERRTRIDDPRGAAAMLALGLHAALVLAVVVAQWRAGLTPPLPRAIPIRIVSTGGAPPPPPRTAPKTDSEPAPAIPTPTPSPKSHRQKLEPPPPKTSPTKLADPTTTAKPKPPTPPPAVRPGAPPTPAPVPPAATAKNGIPSSALVVSPGSGPGIGFAADGPALDEEDFQFPVYIQQMLVAISRNWYRPQAETTGCTVYFRINRDGKLGDWRMEIGSGLPHFDRAALRAVQAAAPLPPLPADFAGPSLGVHLKFQ